MREYELRRTNDGRYYAQLKGYPQVSSPESYGSRKHAITYIANENGMTYEEWVSRKRRNRTNTMNKEEFYDYIQAQFNIDGTASRLISNILDFAEGMDANDQYRVLTALLDGTIGLTDAEIRKVEY